MPKKRKQRGGLFHPYLSGNSPNFLQTLDHKWNGSLDPVPRSGNPVIHTWEFKTDILPVLPTMPTPTIQSPPSPSTIVGGGSRKSRKTYRKRKGIKRKQYRKTYKKL